MFARDKAGNRSTRHRRVAVWSFVFILAGAVALPLGGYVYTGLTAQAAAEKQTNPRANYWRAVRDGNEGYTAVMGQETNVLIQNGGQNWRQARNGPVATIMPWVLAVILAALFLYFLFRGQVKMEGRASGRTVLRWSLPERVLHWYTAILFILLAITGLSLIFGRAALIPVLGPAGFGAWAQFSIYVHNYLGPFFVVGVVLTIIAWIKHNIPNKTDWEWIKQGGGLFGKGKHPHAGRINAGEKILTFWVGMVVLGIAVCITGLMMLGWIGGQFRETMQLTNLIHAIASIIWIALTFGHIYLGAWGVQGTLQGMWKGEVSEEWAKQHHDLWYEEGRKG
ncbi:MAG: formate dehydrogenase subunit gamma [Acidiferrobacterales bacterium]